MSIQALKWVMEDAPVTKPSWLPVLYALANGADEDGCGSRASQATIAHFARKTARAVRMDLAELEAAGLIRRGDQTLVAKLPPDRRPTVWDLALELTRSDTRPAKRHPTGTTAAVSPAEDREEAQFPPVPASVGTGRKQASSRLARPGGSTRSTGGKHASYKPPIEPKDLPPPSAVDNREEAEEASSELTSSAAAFVAGLPGALSHSQRGQLTPAVVEHLAAGWRPAQLLSELTTDSGTARSRFAVYSHRLKQLPTAPPPEPERPAVVGGHAFVAGADGISCAACMRPAANAVHTRSQAAREPAVA